MKKIKWNGEKSVSIAALVISVATLVSLMYQAKIMREHEIKSAFPKLSPLRKVFFIYSINNSLFFVF